MAKCLDGRTHKQARRQMDSTAILQERIVGLYGEQEVKEMAQKYCSFCQFRLNTGKCSHNLIPIQIDGKPCPYYKAPN